MIRTALVGLGRIGWMLEKDSYRYHPCTHAGTMLSLSKEFKIVAGCDLEEDRQEKFNGYLRSKTGESVELYSEIDELIKSIRNKKIEIDFVVIATGPECHFDIFTKLIRVGVKKFLIEKPVALNSKIANKMLDLAVQNNATVFVNFERRYHLAYQQVKHVIESQRFGQLRHIEGRVLATSSKRDVLLEDAVHWIDLLLWYAGQPKKIWSNWKRFDQGNRIQGSLHVFDFGEFNAVLESGGMRRYFEFIMRLDFERGRIIAGNQGHFYFQSAASKRYKQFFELKELKVSNRWMNSNPWIGLYKEIAKNRQCSSSLEQAVTGLEIIDSAKSRKSSIFTGKLK